MKPITDRQRLDWLEKQSREHVVSFHHPRSGFAHVRAAIDAEILKASKPATKKTKKP